MEIIFSDEEEENTIKQAGPLCPDNENKEERERAAMPRPLSNSLLLKAKEIKEKREQQERMKEFMLQPPPDFKMPKKSDKVAKSSVHQKLTEEDGIQFRCNKSEELL